MKFLKVGDKVVPNLENWQRTEVDQFIKPDDLPVGEIIDIDEDCFIDVRWPGGRYYQDIDELEKFDG